MPSPPCSFQAATMPRSRNPAWLIEEYASMRFTFFWTRAATLPTTIVMTATARSSPSRA